MGRPPLPDDQRGRRVTLYLSAAAAEALEAFAGKRGNKSEIVSRLLVEERARVDGKRIR